MKNLNLLIIIGLLGVLFSGCSESFLDAKPNKNMVIPKTLVDLKGMLDNSNAMNAACLGIQQLTDDDIYVPDNIFIPRGEFEQIAYTWEDYDPEIFKSDWNTCYQNLLSINSVIQIASEYEAVNSQESTALNHIIGRAHFFRAVKFWELLQQFALVYNPGSSNDGLGIILRLNNNVFDWQPRATIQESYDQVISDLMLAYDLLPDESDHVMVPSKLVVEAFLARVYLSMSNFQKALEYSNNALNRYSALMDHNNLSKPTPTTNPYPRFNEEVIYHAQLPTYGMRFNGTTGGYVSPDLMVLYHENDLRRTLNFRSFGEFYQMNGHYTGLVIGFGGIATDEIYLIRSESKARTGNIQGAMNDLNTLLVTRWKTGTFVPYHASNEDEALDIILTERRKQLIHRGLRWTDLKRLNLEPRFAKTLTRVVLGNTYTLPPNDLRYALLIPNTEMLYNDLVVQNPR